MYKAIYLVKRKPGMSFEDFKAHQVNVHMPLAHRLPGMRRYHMDWLPPQNGTDQPFDAIVSVWYDDEAGRDAAMGSPEGQAAVADLPNLVDTDTMIVLEAVTELDKTDFPSA